jgi:hypothetical protein
MSNAGKTTKQGVRDLGGNARRPIPKVELPSDAYRSRCRHPARAQRMNGCGFYVTCNDCGQSRGIDDHDY